MKIVTAALLALAMLFSVSGGAMAGQKTEQFAPAYFKGRQVDWCYKFGTLCGKPAADAFCHKKGYQTAIKFARDESPALPTLVLGTNQVCINDGNCKGLISVTCASQTGNGGFDDDVGMNPIGDDDSGSGDQPLKPGDMIEGSLVTHSFKNPQWKGAPLDWCKVFGGQCGKPAADAFCQAKGYAEAMLLQKGQQPKVTRVINGGQICSDVTCRPMIYVKCMRSKNG